MSSKISSVVLLVIGWPGRAMTWTVLEKRSTKLAMVFMVFFGGHSGDEIHPDMEHGCVGTSRGRRSLDHGWVVDLTLLQVVQALTKLLTSRAMMGQHRALRMDLRVLAWPAISKE